MYSSSRMNRQETPPGFVSKLVQKSSIQMSDKSAQYFYLFGKSLNDEFIPTWIFYIYTPESFHLQSYNSRGLYANTLQKISEFDDYVDFQGVFAPGNLLGSGHSFYLHLTTSNICAATAVLECTGFKSKRHFFILQKEKR